MIAWTHFQAVAIFVLAQYSYLYFRLENKLFMKLHIIKHKVIYASILNKVYDLLEYELETWNLIQVRQHF